MQTEPMTQEDAEILRDQVMIYATRYARRHEAEIDLKIPAITTGLRKYLDQHFNISDTKNLYAVETALGANLASTMLMLACHNCENVAHMRKLKLDEPTLDFIVECYMDVVLKAVKTQTLQKLREVSTEIVKRLNTHI